MFHGVMQKDLWDVMSVLGGGAGSTFLSRGSALAQEDQPAPLTDTEAGMASKPTDLTGNAAGAKSYNSRSGQVFGILKGMLDEFKKDLATESKTEEEALKTFNKLKSQRRARSQLLKPRLMQRLPS